MPDPAAAAISAALGIPPNPDIAELTIRAGIDPCHVGGTDIAPTNRALPKSAAIPEPRPPAPPNDFMSGTALPTNFVASAANPAPVALANPAELEFAICAIDISGDIIMLAGYIPIWATDVNDCNGTADCNADSAAAGLATTAATSVINAGPTDDNVLVASAPSEDASATTFAPTCDTQPVNPAKLSGGTLNGVNVAATDVAPT